MRGEDEYGPGVEYPKWISEELIAETIRHFAPKKKDGPFTREEAIDLLIRLGVLLDVTGLLKVELPDIDAEPSSSELPAKSTPAPRKRAMSTRRQAAKETAIKKPETKPMSKSFTCFYDLGTEVAPPDDGTLSRTLHNDDNAKVVLFGFAAGEELSEHTAAMPAIIQIIKGEASLTIGGEAVSGKPGTWIHMPAKMPHSVKAQTPVVMLLTLLK